MDLITHIFPLNFSLLLTWRFLLTIFLIIIVIISILLWGVRAITEYIITHKTLRNYRPEVEQLIDLENNNLALDEGEQTEEENNETTLLLIEDDEFTLYDDTETTDKIIKLDPDEATREQAYRERFRSDANYAKKKGKREDYEKKLIEGMAFDSHNNEVLRALADYYFTYNQSKKALPLLKKIVYHHTDDHKSLRQIAEIYLEGGDLETSELLTSKALSISPQNPKYAITLTEIYYNTGRLDDAIKSMEDVVKWRPSHVGYREALAKLYEEANEIELAQECYQSLIEIDPNNVRAKKKALELRNKM